mgnify:CR=1 FL=1
MKKFGFFAVLLSLGLMVGCGEEETKPVNDGGTKGAGTEKTTAGDGDGTTKTDDGAGTSTDDGSGSSDDTSGGGGF